MEEDEAQSLEERVERLEKALFRIEKVILRRQRQRDEAVKAVITESPRIPEADISTSQVSRPLVSESPEPPFSLPERRISGVEKIVLALTNTEDWFNKIGSGLLFFGLIFLFKYSVDQGWLTPVIRVALGTGLGVGLITIGDRLVRKRRRFSLFLFGSGVISLYTTCFAAYQILELIPSSAAFGIMIAITSFSFVVSVSMDEAMPALLASVGGFATPFLLYSESGSVPGLMLYLSVLVLGCLAVYWYRGWRPLLYVSFVGAGLVLLLTVSNLFLFNDEPIAAHRIPVQLGIVWGWILFGSIPILRERSSSVRTTIPGLVMSAVSDRMRLMMSHHLIALIPVLGAAALAVSVPIWDVGRTTWGPIILGYSALYGLASYILSRSDQTRAYSSAHAVAGVLFFTVGLLVLFQNEALVLALTFEVMILHAVARRFEIERIHIGGHIITALVAVIMWDRLIDNQLDIFDPLTIAAATNLIVIICGFIVSRIMPGQRERTIYAIVVHVGVLLWFLRELSPAENGQALVSIAWGIYAVILLVVGLRKSSVVTRRLALATLALIVAKLFLVDLARLDMIWRVIVFLGFGGGFLVLSYLFKSLNRTPDSEDDSL